MLSKQDRAMRAAYQDWAAYYRTNWLMHSALRTDQHRAAIQLARQCAAQ